MSIYGVLFLLGFSCALVAGVGIGMFIGTRCR